MRIRFLSDVFVAVPSSLRKLTIVKRKIVSITLTEQYSMLNFFFYGCCCRAAGISADLLLCLVSFFLRFFVLFCLSAFFPVDSRRTSNDMSRSLVMHHEAHHSEVALSKFSSHHP